MCKTMVAYHFSDTFLSQMSRVSMRSTSRGNVPRSDWMLPQCDEVMQAAGTDG